ncbi:hypothetical protein BJ878DRAFT_537219 [Calycina marina]|uniref:Uncharacterized protein n=1 Tax=Calycina marina TaxID=1763456 RepID=A0A9P7YV65_9HELO|nr:hypothetical protein BJ878DRAFT_537219 [Calycina marina]
MNVTGNAVLPIRRQGVNTRIYLAETELSIGHGIQVDGEEDQAPKSPLPFPTVRQLGSHVEEVAIARLTEEVFFNFALQYKSWTGFRLAMKMLIQGFISGINAMDNRLLWTPFLSLEDIIGRRDINFLGNFIVIIAANLRGCSTNLEMLTAGRFLLVLGSGMTSSAQYMGDVTSAHLRGRLIGVFGACFQVGSLAINGPMIGFTNLGGSCCWRVPILLEALFPAHQSLDNGRRGYQPYCAYRTFFAKGARYHLLVLIFYSNGGGTIGQYMVPALETLGVNGLAIMWIFLSQTFSSLLIATMHNSYPVGILSLTLRAKGMGFYGLIQKAAGTVSNYEFKETDAAFEKPGVRPVKMTLDIQKVKKGKARL